MNITISQIGQLSQLAELFRLFNNGKHLNRITEPVLWAELERDVTTYRELFTSLGYELRIDERGFAWFHNEDANSNVNKNTRQLALLFMVIFDTQADAGKPLVRFVDWRIDRTLLTEAHEQHQDLLIAEGLDIDNFMELLNTACRYGFAQQEQAYWRLLPAVCRYLDHFETLAAANHETLHDGCSDDKLKETTEEGDEA